MSPQAPSQAQTPQTKLKDVLPLTLDDEFFLKRVLDWKEERRKAEEAWRRLPETVRSWLEEHGFDDPIYVLEPSEALYKLVMALRGEYDYSIDTIETDDGDAVIVDVWTPGIGYDTVIVILPDGEVIAFQYG